MEILHSLVVILAVFISLIILDYLWLGIITKNFIINQFGSLIKTQNGSIAVTIWAGLIAWLLIAVGVFVFAINPSSTFSQAMLYGALLGFIIYGVYDFTNLSFLVNYPKLFIVVDVIWGSVVCSMISGIGFFVKNLLN